MHKVEGQEETLRHNAKHERGETPGRVPLQKCLDTIS